jgi:hypothetical protein
MTAGAVLGQGGATAPEAPAVVAYAADRDLWHQPQFIACDLVPGVRYRLTAVTEGVMFTEDRAALVFFDMSGPELGGEGLQVSARGTVPPHLHLRTGDQLHRTERAFTVASPVQRIGLRTWGDRGPVTLRTLAIEVLSPAPVDFFFSFDVEASPHKAAIGESAIDALVWGRLAGGEYGISRICGVLEQYGIVGNFMIDFGSCTAEGPAPLARIFDHLLGRGHEVHLHLHPEDLPDPTKRAIERDRLARTRRVSLDQSDFELSQRLLEYSMAVYERFAQRPPRVFRSGAYRMSADLVRAAGEVGLEALSNVREGVIGDPALRGGDAALLEPYTWENGVIELPIDCSSPEAARRQRYDTAFQRAQAKQVARTFNVVMHSWSLTGRDEDGVHDRFAPQAENRLHEMCEQAIKEGRARGYGEYLDAHGRPGHTVRLSAIRTSR